MLFVLCMIVTHLQQTPLKIAVIRGNIPIAKLLLKHGAKVDATGDNVSESASTLQTDYVTIE